MNLKAKIYLLYRHRHHRYAVHGLHDYHPQDNHERNVLSCRIRNKSTFSNSFLYKIRKKIVKFHNKTL
jgi:hypothetical protein